MRLADVHSIKPYILGGHNVNMELIFREFKIQINQLRFLYRNERTIGWLIMNIKAQPATLDAPFGGCYFCSFILDRP